MERKEREKNHIDPEVIKENVNNTKYTNDIKQMLLCFSLELNSLLYKKEISQEDFSKITKIGQTSISKYRNGTALPKQENIDIIAKALGVSSEYLVGKSKTKDYSYNQLNKLFGFNDETINNLSSCFNKDYLNNMFGGELDSINYFLERLKNYVDAKNEYKKEKKELNKAWDKNKIDEAKYYLTNSLIDLIDENLK